MPTRIPRQDHRFKPRLPLDSSRPGSSARYERGTILTGGEELVFAAGPVRRALETTARAAGLDGDAVSDYLDAVRSVVREMAAHGHGGIVIISHEEEPQVAAVAPYKMALDSSLAALLRLVGRIKWTSGASDSASGNPPFGHLLRNALLTEIERVIEEFGALTAIDGAILLNRDLALIAFGVILPVGRPTAVAQAVDAEGQHGRIIDLGSRGTRHRAGVTLPHDIRGAWSSWRRRTGRSHACFARRRSIRCAYGDWDRPMFISHDSKVDRSAMVSSHVDEVRNTKVQSICGHSTTIVDSVICSSSPESIEMRWKASRHSSIRSFRLPMMRSS